MTLFLYIFKDILKSTVAVSLVLLLIVSSGRLAKYLSQASSGDLAPELVFSIIAFRLPDFLPLILPLGTFVGVMLVIGRLYIDSEMAVLYSSGISKLRILFYVVVPAFLLSTVVAFLSLYGAPKSLSQVEKLLAQSRSSHSLMLFREGKFITDRDGEFAAYIGKIGTDSSLERIFMMQQQRPSSSSDREAAVVGGTSILIATDGLILPGGVEDERIIELQAGRMYESRGEALDYRVSQFESYTQRVQLSRGAEERKLNIDTTPTLDLFDSDSPKYQAALHWRFSLPVTVIVVAVLAVAMSKTDPRRGRYARMLPAIMIYLVYIVSLSAVRNLIEEEDLPATSIWALHGAYLLAALSIYFWQEINRFFTGAQAAAA